MWFLLIYIVFAMCWPFVWPMIFNSTVNHFKIAGGVKTSYGKSLLAFCIPGFASLLCFGNPITGAIVRQYDPVNDFLAITIAMSLIMTVIYAIFVYPTFWFIYKKINLKMSLMLLIPTLIFGAAFVPIFLIIFTGPF